jgi:hypothetical protein
MLVKRNIILSKGSYRKCDSFASYFSILYLYFDAAVGLCGHKILRAMPAVA